MTVVTRVLLADDDDEIRDLVAVRLMSAGYVVEAVSDGGQALAAIRASRPDLAVLDVSMPTMTGLEVLRAVRADPELCDLKVLLLTANSRNIDVDSGFEYGADDYVIKPFNSLVLLHRVASLIRRPTSPRRPCSTAT